jgi:hypothetical protein
MGEVEIVVYIDDVCCLMTLVAKRSDSLPEKASRV